MAFRALSGLFQRSSFQKIYPLTRICTRRSIRPEIKRIADHQYVDLADFSFTEAFGAPNPLSALSEAAAESSLEIRANSSLPIANTLDCAVPSGATSSPKQFASPAHHGSLSAAPAPSAVPFVRAGQPSNASSFFSLSSSQRVLTSASHSPSFSSSVSSRFSSTMIKSVAISATSLAQNSFLNRYEEHFRHSFSPSNQHHFHTHASETEASFCGALTDFLRLSGLQEQHIIVLKTKLPHVFFGEDEDDLDGPYPGEIWGDEACEGGVCLRRSPLQSDFSALSEPGFSSSENVLQDTVSDGLSPGGCCDEGSHCTLGNAFLSDSDECEEDGEFAGQFSSQSDMEELDELMNGMATVAPCSDVLPRRMKQRIARILATVAKEYLLHCTHAPDDAVSSPSSLHPATEDDAMTETFLKQCLSYQANVFGRNHLVTMEMVDLLGVFYTRLGLFELATPLFDEAFTARTRKLLPHHALTLDSCEHLARAHHLNGNAPAALSYYRLLLEARTQTLGEQNVHHIDLLDLIGILHYNCKEYSDALVCLAEALELVRRKHGPVSLPAATAYVKLATVLRTTCHYDMAETALERAVAIVASVFGEHAPESVPPQLMIAEIMLDQGRYPNALQILQTLLSIPKLPPDDLAHIQSLISHCQPVVV